MHTSTEKATPNLFEEFPNDPAKIITFFVLNFNIKNELEKQNSDAEADDDGSEKKSFHFNDWLPIFFRPLKGFPRGRKETTFFCVSRKNNQRTLCTRKLVRRYAQQQTIRIAYF